jgi:hypothetical protein
MTIPDRFARLSKLSSEHHDIAVELDWRYPYLLEFLRLSPSYRLAHLIATGETASDAQPLPADFALVQQTYAAFGDVYGMHFSEWWLNVAQFRFGVSTLPKPRRLLKLDEREEAPNAPVENMRKALERYAAIERPSEGLPAVLLVAIPVSRDRKRVLREIAALIDEEFGAEHADTAGSFAQLIDNKMRESTLETALRVLHRRCRNLEDRLFEIGNATHVANQYRTKSGASRRDKEVDYKRYLMEIVTSRHLRRAYVIAENAARSRFPSLSSLPTDPGRPEFDYPALAERLEADNRRLWARIPMIDDRASVLATARVKNKRILHAKHARYRGAKLTDIMFEIAPENEDISPGEVALPDGVAKDFRVNCLWNNAHTLMQRSIHVRVTGGYSVRREAQADVAWVIGRE